MKKQSIVLVLAGILVGCGAGATVAVSWAGPTAGQWQCYRINDLPDLQDAATNRHTRHFTPDMNKIAPASPVGTVIQIKTDYGEIICAKN